MKAIHKINSNLLHRADIAVVGCGGTGAVVASGLALLHKSLVAFGHPGLSVTVYDPDTISASNTVRQPFTTSEIGLNKAVVLVTRINAFHGLDWQAQPTRYGAKRQTDDNADVVIGCVDTRAARKAIHMVVTKKTSRVSYWLDFGNDSASGQFLIGQPCNAMNHSDTRLLTIAERFPEVIDARLDDKTMPSCSAQEALERQECFTNQALAYAGLALFGRLFRYGQIDHCGAFSNFASGRTSPISICHP